MTIHLRSLPKSLRQAVQKADAKASPSAPRQRVRRTKPAPMPGEPVPVAAPAPARKPRTKKPRPPSATTPRRAVQHYEEEGVSFAVALKPRPKERARHSVRGGKVVTYCPEQTAEHEAGIRLAATAAMAGREPMTCPVEVILAFTFQGDPLE